MATKIISQGWQLSLPNDFLTDHSFSDGKQRDQTYDGPDKIFLQINAEGKEVYGPLTEDDIADGRPKPLDVVQWYEVDCADQIYTHLFANSEAQLSTRRKKIEVLDLMCTMLDLQT